MDFSGALVNGLLSIVGYVVIFLGVYKIFQIATDIREIKGLVAAAAHRGPNLSALPSAIAPVTSHFTKDLLADDSASAYAEQLLRAVNSESTIKQSEPTEVR